MKNAFRWALPMLLCGLLACDDDGETGAEPGTDAAQGGGGEGAAGEGGNGEGGSAGEGGEGGGEPVDVKQGLQALEIEADEEPLAGRTLRFTVTGSYEDGSTRDLSDEVELSSTDEDIVRFLEGAEAELPYGGDVTVTATLGEISADFETTVECDYPRFPANIRMGQPVAAVKWGEAYGANDEAMAFDFRKAHCYAEYKDVEAFVLIVNAAWCAPCIQEIQRVGPRAGDLLEAGGLLLYIVLQDVNYGPISAANANRHINRLVGPDSPGIRMGSVEADPNEFFNNQAIIQAFPTSFVVRKSDMQVIADSRGLQYHLDPYFGAILEDLDADWADPAATAPLPFDSNCEDGDEEDSEPNDTLAQAAPIEPGSFDAGICTREPDFYRITTDGAWTFTVSFSHATGDIDIGLWDEATDQFARQNGQPVLSQGQGDMEQLQGTGPAVVVVYGYAGASAPYSVTLQ